jgi:hypothetical protein
MIDKSAARGSSEVSNDNILTFRRERTRSRKQLESDNDDSDAPPITSKKRKGSRTEELINEAAPTKKLKVVAKPKAIATSSKLTSRPSVQDPSVAQITVLYPSCNWQVCKIYTITDGIFGHEFSGRA